MNKLVIMADTGCDIAPEVLKKWDVACIDLLFREENSEKVYTQKDIATDEFYQLMKDGKVFRTSAANMDDFTKAFEPYLQEGQDILYIGFSSGLSSTVGTGAIVANELMEKYPERKIKVVDTLCASAGHGLVVYYAIKKREEGASIDEIAAFLNKEIIPGLCHWFTVGDLVYLKRSGRCSAAAAFMGNVLNIKPVLHVDEEGHLIPMFKVHGRKKSIAAVADKYTELAKDAQNGIYFICHGDCPEDARALEDMINARHGHKAELITDIGPVIGSHSGPGTLAVFFVGKER